MRFEEARGKTYRLRADRLRGRQAGESPALQAREALGADAGSRGLWPSWLIALGRQVGRVQAGQRPPALRKRQLGRFVAATHCPKGLFGRWCPSGGLCSREKPARAFFEVFPILLEGSGSSELVSGQRIRSWEGCALRIVVVTLGDPCYGGRRSPQRAGAQ